MTEPVTGRATESGRSTVYAPRGTAATSQPLATATAVKILQDGGNAIDAAVAAAAVLNVTEPHMTGIGGDMFAILWSEKEGGLVGLDASGKSGSKLDVQELIDAGVDAVPERGARSVTVPGALSGWSALIEAYGSKPLADLLAPAIRIAEEGFPVTPIIARDWASSAEGLRGDPGATATFLIDGQAPRCGDWFRNPDLARTFQRVADGGPETFYGGALGREIVAGLDSMGGYLTIEDLERQEVRWVEPLSVDYKAYTLYELPPAGQGVAALQMLKILEGFDLTSMGHNSAAYLHTLIEAKKLAYADLARFVADPEHMSVRSEALLDSHYLEERASLIDSATAADRPSPGHPVTDSETIYLTVSDRYGNMISFINSISAHFGALVVVPGTGFALQSRGAGFTMEESHPNRVAPDKRPFHTIIPAFVSKHGQPWLSFGVMGGPMQPQGHVQVLLNMVEFEMDVQEAIDAPRFRHSDGRSVAIENLDAGVAARLEAMGHELDQSSDVAFGGAQAIRKLDRGWAAGSDPRKDGMASGH